MQKTLLTLAILSFAAAASAAPDSQETPLHPIKDGRYTVTTGYRYNNQKGNDGGKASVDSFTLSGRADIPLAQQHAIRAELGYVRSSVDMKANGVTVVDGGKADAIELYAGYLYSPSGFKQGGLRVGGGWSITPWGEAQVSVRRRAETKWSQAFAVPDETYKGRRYGLGLGVDVQKQFTPNLALTFGPYYQYDHFKTPARDHAGTHFDSTSDHGHNFGIRAGLRF